MVGRLVGLAWAGGRAQRRLGKRTRRIPGRDHEHAQGSTSLEGVRRNGSFVFDLGVLQALDSLGVEAWWGSPRVANMPEDLSEQPF